MSVDLIYTEDFLSEIESRPAIWDVISDNYSNKVVKTNAWQETIANFVPDFNEESMNERSKICTFFSTVKNYKLHFII